MNTPRAWEVNAITSTSRAVVADESEKEVRDVAVERDRKDISSFLAQHASNSFVYNWPSYPLANSSSMVLEILRERKFLHF